MYRSTIYLFIVILTIGYVDCWSPDAGYIPRYTAQTITTTSTYPPAPTSYLTDNNIGTCWNSEAPYPDLWWQQRTDLNVLLGVCTSTPSRCSGTSSGVLTDGKVDNSLTFTSPLYVNFTSATPLFTLGTKITQSSSSVSIDIYVNNQWKNLFSISNGNYSWISFKSDGSNQLTSVRVSSSSSFSIAELALQPTVTFEEVVIDFGTNQKVGYVVGNFASGNTFRTVLSIGDSTKSQWTQFGTTNNTLWAWQVVNKFNDTVGRYLRARVEMPSIDYVKASICEIKVYDQWGPWGAAPIPKENSHTMFALSGVNAIWGFATGSYSDNTQLESPRRFAAVGSHGRNYHEMSWDVTKPTDIVNYTAMGLGKGTPGQWWLNWNTEYDMWLAAPLNIELSIQFLNDSFPPSLWGSDPETTAYNYGRNLAAYFGPNSTSLGKGIAKWVSIGNEPWNYQAVFYNKVLRGMARGMKDANTGVTVLTCALQADEPEVAGAAGGNYIGARVQSGDLTYIDGLSIHAYAWYTDNQGKNAFTYPENRQSGMNAVRNFIRWRDANAPSKTVELTEWGWDSNGPGPNDLCVPDQYHNSCVSQEAQAVYAIRGLLKFAREGVDRATWYNAFDSSATGGLFGKSGFVGAKDNGFGAKKSFGVLSTFMKYVGSMNFITSLLEDDTSVVYLLGNATHRAILAWKPIDYSDGSTSTITLPILSNMLTPPPSPQGYQFTSESSNGPTTISTAYTSTSDNKWSIPISKNVVLIYGGLPSTTTANPVTSATSSVVSGGATSGSISSSTSLSPLSSLPLLFISILFIIFINSV